MYIKSTTEVILALAVLHDKQQLFAQVGTQFNNIL